MRKRRAFLCFLSGLAGAPNSRVPDETLFLEILSLGLDCSRALAMPIDECSEVALPRKIGRPKKVKPREKNIEEQVALVGEDSGVQNTPTALNEGSFAGFL